jgi:hypothetical protein
MERLTVQTPIEAAADEGSISVGDERLRREEKKEQRRWRILIHYSDLDEYSDRPNAKTFEGERHPTTHFNIKATRWRAWRRRRSSTSCSERRATRIISSLLTSLFCWERKVMRAVEAQTPEAY